MIPLELGMYFTLGANIGSAIAPVVMTLRDIPAGRRVPLGNLVTRVIGVLIFMPFMQTLVSPLMEMIDPEPARMIVNFHTFFNIVIALAFLPFIGPMTRLSEIVLPDRPREGRREPAALPRPPTAFATPPAALAWRRARDAAHFRRGAEDDAHDAGVLPLQQPAPRAGNPRS